MPQFEAALSEKFSPDVLDGIGVPEGELATDIYADREYRAHLINVLTQRAVSACI
jgi:carbon-monoxide dehydrogenase medium subunit